MHGNQKEKKKNDHKFRSSGRKIVVNNELVSILCITHKDGPITGCGTVRECVEAFEE